MPKTDPLALPSLPRIKLSIDRDRSEHAPRGAFLTVRRLERVYGKGLVQKEYERLAPTIGRERRQ